MLKFSIIIPSYNRAYILEQTLQSLQKQQYTNFEVLIIDDGSTDNTKQLARQFQEDSRFHYYYQKNQGVSVARQYGLELAQGDIVTYVDSDDPIFEHYLQTARDIFITKCHISFCLSNCNFYVDLLNRAGETLASKHVVTHSESVSLHDIYHWKKRIALGTGLFFRREKFQKAIRWQSKLPCFEDLDFVMQLACIDQQGYYFIPDILFDYHQRYGFDGTCSSISYEQWAEAFAMLLELHQHDPLLTKPAIYLEKIKKYKDRQASFDKGEYIAPEMKYFPEFQSEKIISKEY